MDHSELPRSGDIYRHFKNKLYQIVGIAFDSETASPAVVYQALYGDYRLWIRPLEDFLSEVDHEKYPAVKQKFRFERIVPKPEEICGGNPRAGSPAEEKTEAVNPILSAFLDTDDREARKALLIRNIDGITQQDLDSIYLSYGITGYGGSIKQQAEGLIKYMDMQEQYEGDHLRGGNTSCSILGKN